MECDLTKLLIFVRFYRIKTNLKKSESNIFLYDYINRGFKEPLSEIESTTDRSETKQNKTNANKLISYENKKDNRNISYYIPSVITNLNLPQNFELLLRKAYFGALKVHYEASSC